MKSQTNEHFAAAQVKRIPDFLAGARMCRLEWRIQGRSGHGEWFHEADAQMLEIHAARGNKDFGPGTHWLFFQPIK